MLEGHSKCFVMCGQKEKKCVVGVYVTQFMVQDLHSNNVEHHHMLCQTSCYEESTEKGPSPTLCHPPTQQNRP